MIVCAMNDTFDVQHGREFRSNLLTLRESNPETTAPADAGTLCGGDE
jgi:hypothetical protein